MADDLLQVQRKQRGRPFRKGESGNPAGRPAGVRNRATVAPEALLDGEAEALTRRAVELALGGGRVALRLCLDRIVAPRRERGVALDLPPLRDVGDLAPMMAGLAAAIAAGAVAPAGAGDLARFAEAYIRAVEVGEVERRLQALEAGAAELAAAAE